MPIADAAITRISRFPKAAPKLPPQKRGETQTVESFFRLADLPKPFDTVVWQARFTERGLNRLSIVTARKAALVNTENEHPLIQKLQQKIRARLTGKRVDLSWEELDLRGTPAFHQRVWKAMMGIPFGTVASYAEVAEMAGSPLAFRACGQACGSNPILIFIPCHRVVGSNGAGGFGCGLEWKRALLEAEGFEWVY